MTNRPYAKNAIYVAPNTSATGSFSKIFVSGSNTVFSRIEWGTHSDPLDPALGRNVERIVTFPANTYLEGPITAFFIQNGTAGVIAYKE